MPASDLGRELKIGIDVGGTNTDAVVLDRSETIVARAKRPTTSDVRTGIGQALSAVLGALGEREREVGRIMLGTTHATNALLQRRGLGRVAVIRLGAPAGTAVAPLTTWPADLAETVSAGSVMVGGGHFVDGWPIAPLDRDAIRRFLASVADRADAVAVTGIFSPAAGDQEQEVAALVHDELGAGVAVSMSHEIGSLGLLERENATVLNAALYRVAGEVTQALDAVLAERGLDVAAFFAQNDGTLMALDYASRYPVLTIGSGPANSIRGAAFLSGVDDAIVIDVGGTSTDLGVLVRGFPRESSFATVIGGVRTNFRMPDILSVAVGGGTIVGGTPDDPAVGPVSVGFRITSESLAFGGDTPTLTDAAVLADRVALGTPHKSPAQVRTLLRSALDAADGIIADAVDQMSLGRKDRPVVAVGGGAFLVPDRLAGGAKVLRPDHADVANAVGAAIALVSGRWETLAPAGDGRRKAIEDAGEKAVRRAVQAGADPDAVQVIEITETPLSYLHEPAVRINVKAAGPLGWL
ncbi:hydantoinase/oxoprolinase family protein [Nonomuraea turcica]|uniref:hydantoinase/oxoprolinase family protein n=1 Tax=Nonomuraea sp. G32 TaxID=3067274 RepID=UPI00273B12EA|nr:hydantoinase/oxoprolinase family protein [Nonomuraea sp. G32]MDP4501316.1 hydantoinase/oxoprolinase family protein [Nonomuraea sp. G32]